MDERGTIIDLLTQYSKVFRGLTWLIVPVTVLEILGWWWGVGILWLRPLVIFYLSYAIIFFIESIWHGYKYLRQNN